MKKPVFNYLIELIIVAFGVFMGILVSEYKAETKIKKNIESSISLIINEMESNIKNIDRAIQYHTHIKKGYDSLIVNMTEDIVYTSYFTNHKFRAEHIPGWNGLWNGTGSLEIEDIAFESAKTGGIFQNMDIHQIELISSAYRKLHNHSEFGNLINSRYMGMDSETKVMDVVGTLQILTNDFLSNEIFLKTELEKTVEQLRKQSPN